MDTFSVDLTASELFNVVSALRTAHDEFQMHGGNPCTCSDIELADRLEALLDNA